MTVHAPLENAYDPMATPLTDEEVEIANKFPLTAHGLWISAEFARDLERRLHAAERDLRIAQCPLHDCCGGVGKCAYYD